MKVFLERTMDQTGQASHAGHLNFADEIRCNMCGVEIRKNVFGYFEDHLSVAKTWGYGTTADGETHTFDFCFDCYSELTEQFKIPLNKIASNIVYDYEMVLAVGEV